MTGAAASSTSTIDALIIGGGFYGCALALFLHRHGHEVLILEAGNDLMLRASYVNQARIHGGYHYPRSFITAWRSLVNFPRFVLDFRECVDQSFEKVYAIARNHSKVNASQFKQFCRNIGAPIRQAALPVRRLFNPSLIEDVFIVRELAFNAAILRSLMHARLAKAGIRVLLNTAAVQVAQVARDNLRVTLSSGETLHGRAVFNCTYAQLNTVLKDSGLPLLPLKHEITELALVEPPPALRELGVTVMDGPFFSIMPFPEQRLHSLSHVRYTPHEAWADTMDGYRNPYAYLSSLDIRSNAPFMLRDAERYLPALGSAQYIRSLYEVKTVLLKNETDDGRPILCREHYGLRNLHLVMGSKIDNIYDVLHYLQAVAVSLNQASAEPI